MQDPKGSFSVKGAVKLAQARRRPTRLFLEEQDWSNLWRLPLQDRLKLLLWKIAAETIPVRAPSFHSLNDNPSFEVYCVGCGQQLETIMHVFHGCTVTRFLWSTSPWSLDISCIPVSSLANWIHVLLNAETTLGISSRSFPSFILRAALTMDVVWFLEIKLSMRGRRCWFRIYESLCLVGFWNTRWLG